MNKYLIFICAVMSSLYSFAQYDKNIMSDEYWKLWNDSVQSRIDSGIEKYRKGDITLNFPDAKFGTKVNIEQISHSFIFGANIFVFGQLKTTEENNKYKDLFGTLFNSATLPFYWKTLEPRRGFPRYTKESDYTFRRPPTDDIVEFCKEKNIIPKGHAIIYGMRRWGHPDWMPNDRDSMECIFKNHVNELSARYGDKIKIWDVVNEPIDQANRGIMPDDYTYKVFRWAMKAFPKNVIFNINDVDMHSPWSLDRRYAELTRNLIDRGVRIDNIGVQMHIFDPKEVIDIAKGEKFITPEHLFGVLNCLNEVGIPIHISEITICSPDSTLKGEQIQSIILENFYRLCFSYPSVEAITWWNVVDGGGAPGEPSFSGLFTNDMKPKMAYNVLNNLINNEWKTKLTTKTDKNGNINVRGFKGTYKATYKNKKGLIIEKQFNIN